VKVSEKALSSKKGIHTEDKLILLHFLLLLRSTWYWLLTVVIWYWIFVKYLYVWYRKIWEYIWLNVFHL